MPAKTQSSLSSSSSATATGAVALAMSDVGQEQLLQQLLARKAAMVSLARQRARVARAADAMLATANAEKDKAKAAKAEADALQKLSSLQQHLPASSPAASSLEAQPTPTSPLASLKQRPQSSTLQGAIDAAKAKKAPLEGSAFSLMPSNRPTPAPAALTGPYVEDNGDLKQTGKQVAAAAVPSPRTANLIHLRPVVPIFKANTSAPPTASSPVVVGYDLQPGVGLRVGEVVECMYGDSSPPTFFPGVIEKVHTAAAVNTPAQGKLAPGPLAVQTPGEPLYDVRYDDGTL